MNQPNKFQCFHAELRYKDIDRKLRNIERGLTPEPASGGQMGGLAPADFGPWLLTLFTVYN